MKNKIAAKKIMAAALGMSLVFSSAFFAAPQIVRAADTTASATTASDTEATDTEDEDVSENADKVLKTKAKSLAKKDKKEGYANLTYGLYDINGDDVNEMIYVRQGLRAQVLVFRYDTDDEKAVLVKQTNGKKSFTGVKSVLAKGKKIVFDQAYSAAEGEIVTCTLTDDGEFKVVSRYKSNYLDNKFTKNGKSISQKAYENYAGKMAKKYESVDCYTEL